MKLSIKNKIINTINNIQDAEIKKEKIDFYLEKAEAEMILATGISDIPDDILIISTIIDMINYYIAIDNIGIVQSQSIDGDNIVYKKNEEIKKEIDDKLKKIENKYKSKKVVLFYV